MLVRNGQPSKVCVLILAWWLGVAIAWACPMLYGQAPKGNEQKTTPRCHARLKTGSDKRPKFENCEAVCRVLKIDCGIIALRGDEAVTPVHGSLSYQQVKHGSALAFYSIVLRVEL